jgi:HK97 family phage major capsid protein
MMAQMAKAIARAIDDAIINGDLATHQDSDSRASGDHRLAWEGLRSHALAYSTTPLVPKIDAGGALDIADLMDIKSGMGIYGSRPNQGVWIAGFRSLMALMGAQENSFSYFLTPDKYSGAALETGEVGRVFGSPVILSEFMRENLNASGVYDGTTVTKSSLLYLNREGYALGERRALTLNRSDDLYMETDQIMVMSTWRGDFKPWYSQATEETAARIVGIAYNI